MDRRQPKLSNGIKPTVMISSNRTMFEVLLLTRWTFIRRNSNNSEVTISVTIVFISDSTMQPLFNSNKSLHS
jgi:hypothetical protein